MDDRARREELAQKELLELYKWGTAQEDALIEEAKAAGTYEPGLDGNKELFTDLRKEELRRFWAIIDKYNLREENSTEGE